MMRLVLALLACLIAAPASAQLGGGLMFPGPGTPHSAGGGSPIVPDPNAAWTSNIATNSGAGNAFFLLPNMSTTNTNDILILAVWVNGTTVTSVADSAGLTWTLRASFVGTNSQPLYIYTAKASAALTNNSITVSIASSAGGIFCVASVASFSGLHFAAPFDSNVSLPTTGTTATVTTSNANDLLIGAEVSSTATSTATGSWTQIYGNNFLAFVYQVVSATQSGTSLGFSVGASTGDGQIADALIQGP